MMAINSLWAASASSWASVRACWPSAWALVAARRSSSLVASAAAAMPAFTARSARRSLCLAAISFWAAWFFRITVRIWNIYSLVLCMISAVGSSHIMLLMLVIASMASSASSIAVFSVYFNSSAMSSGSLSASGAHTGAFRMAGMILSWRCSSLVSMLSNAWAIVATASNLSVVFISSNRVGSRWSAIVGSV